MAKKKKKKKKKILTTLFTLKINLKINLDFLIKLVSINMFKLKLDFIKRGVFHWSAGGDFIGFFGVGCPS